MCGGKAFRPPAISDLFMPPTTYMGMIFEGNPDLEPETLLSGEFGLRQNINVAGKRLSVDAVVYRSRGEDFWDYMVVNPLPLTLKPMNVNAVNIFGGELEIAALLSPYLKVSLGYTYTDARYATYKPDPTIEHNHVEDIPQHSGSAALSYRSYEGHTAFIVLRVVGDRYTDPEDDIANKLHSFAVLQLGGTAKISDHARAFARVDNVTDRKYREVLGQIQPGRAFTVGLSLDF
jgi:outer membrane receptor protein involved in Fe transport